MKRKLLLFLLITSIIAFAPEKEYKLTEGQAIMVYDQSQIIKEYLPVSDLPAKTATELIRRADSIQRVIATQYNKFHADTTKKK